MSKNEFSNGDFIVCVPHRIEADWDEKWGSLLAGFPLNIMYACVQRAESDQSKMLGITASYEPDLATFRETQKTWSRVPAGRALTAPWCKRLWLGLNGMNR
jgi:hypothetical protein